MPRFFDVASRIVRPINSTWLLKKKKKEKKNEASSEIRGDEIRARRSTFDFIFKA